MSRIAIFGLVLALSVLGCAGREAASRGAQGGDGTLRLSFVGEPRSLNPNLWLDEHAMLVGQNILAADLPIVPLVESVRVTLVRDGLRGLAQDDARGLIPEHTYSLIRLPEGGR